MGAYFQIKCLEKEFGAFRLGPISLSLAENDYLVLLGSTGSGKTSLLRCIVGITGKIRNSIFLDGRDIGMLPPQKRHIGYVAQTVDLFPHLSVRKNIAFGLAYQKIGALSCSVLSSRPINRWLHFPGERANVQPWREA